MPDLTLSGALSRGIKRLPSNTQPNGAISLIYVGAVILAISVLTLAIGLIRAT
ncbi:MAG: hypothetical protein JWO71_3746 [Candidatus Acidoferrum typicum]|nr:hypothetical protein [Candidatus Acidoferrum typicum]